MVCPLLFLLFHLDRRDISVAIEVAHGFRVVSQVVTRIDLDARPRLDNGDEAAARERARIKLAATEDVKYTTETWGVTDASANGVGVTLTKSVGAWVKIGDLQTNRETNRGQTTVSAAKNVTINNNRGQTTNNRGH